MSPEALDPPVDAGMCDLIFRRFHAMFPTGNPDRIRNMRILVLSLSMWALSGKCLPAVGGERDEKVIADREELRADDTWIYNDLTRAEERAAAVGKPLLIVFRCIP